MSESGYLELEVDAICMGNILSIVEVDNATALSQPLVHCEVTPFLSRQTTVRQSTRLGSSMQATKTWSAVLLNITLSYGQSIWLEAHLDMYSNIVEFA